MLRACAIAVALAACGKPSADAPAPPQPPIDAAPAPKGPAHREFPTAADAVRSVLASGPRVLGVGEYHQTEATAQVPSALARFTAQVLPLLRGKTTDLVVESWADRPNCDEEAKHASAEVAHDMERPPATEDEVVTLLKAARASGIRPHLLPFDCADYRGLLGADGQVDYEKLLLLVTARLRAEALAGLRQPDAVLVMYGGATHNDLYPNEGVADFSYAREVDAASGGRYVELDLVVPEYVTGDETVAGEPWAPLLRDARADRVILVERGARAYTLILEKTAR